MVRCFCDLAADRYTSRNTTINDDDTHVDVLINYMQGAWTEEAYRQAGHDFQRHVVENLLVMSVGSVSLLQAARASVVGYE
jgi:hypothetical protein